MGGAKQCRPPMQGTGGTGPLPLELASPCPHTLARASCCSLSSFHALSRSRGAPAASHERVLMDPSSGCPNRARERLRAVHVEMLSCTQPHREDTEARSARWVAGCLCDAWVCYFPRGGAGGECAGLRHGSRRQ